MLVYQRAPDWLQVIDQRDPTTPRVHTFHGIDAAIYEFCGDTDRSATRVAGQLQQQYGAEIDIATVEGIMRRFCDTGLMIEEGGHYFSLAFPVNSNW